MATITETLSRWASALRFEHLTPESIAAAKSFLYDSLGCALGGYQTHDPKLVLQYIDEVGGKPVCTLIGSGRKTDDGQRRLCQLAHDPRHGLQRHLMEGGSFAPQRHHPSCDYPRRTR